MTAGRWAKKRALIVVRTYPVPANKGIEVSCTAAITEAGEWIRLFPIPYRFLDEDKRFTKYQWIEADMTKARNDPRPESYTLNDKSIHIVSTLGPESAWRFRWERVAPLVVPSLCELQKVQRERRQPTLGVFKPREIKRLTIKPVSPNWDAKQEAALNQQLLPFQQAPDQKLEKIPFEFKYSFRCLYPECNGHEMICTDWEMGQAYRSWKNRYSQNWEDKFRERFESDMKEKYDTHFFVGTMHEHPNNWIIVGLFYPPKPKPLSLFDPA